jgi:hypothetical protein
MVVPGGGGLAGMARPVHVSAMHRNDAIDLVHV